jgi:hypothetical protein
VLSCTLQPLSLPPQSLIDEANNNVTTAQTKEEIKAARGETEHKPSNVRRDTPSVGFAYGAVSLERQQSPNIGSTHNYLVFT